MPQTAGRWIRLPDKKTRKLAFLGLFAAAAILIGYVEAMIPVSFAVPGIKLGLCNIVVLLLIEFYSWREALAVSVVRIFAVGFLFGNLFSIAYALSGSLFSIAVMTLLKKTGKFGILGISSVGGAAHNTGQVVMACLILKGFPWQLYLPVLLLAGLATGLVTGMTAYLTGSRLRGKVSPERQTDS